MIKDAFLQFAVSQRPLLSIGAGVNVPSYYPLPEGFTGAAIRSIDLRTVMDKGQGYTLTARFDIKQTFATTDGAMKVALCVLVSDTDDGIQVPVPLPIVRSLRFTTISALAAGTFYELPIPKLPSIVTETAGGGSAPNLGRRFLALGMEIDTNITIGNALFTAGLLDANIVLDSRDDRRVDYPGGFVA